MFPKGCHMYKIHCILVIVMYQLYGEIELVNWSNAFHKWILIWRASNNFSCKKIQCFTRFRVDISTTAPYNSSIELAGHVPRP